MNKTVLKMFACFVAISALISTVLLAINFIGFAIIGSNQSKLYEHSEAYILQTVAENLETHSGFRLSDDSIIPPDCWCILINDNGDVVWSYNNPGDIPMHYSINDIARMTRWYLNDYPVYVRTEPYGLIVLGTPKDSVGKYDMQYSMEWFNTLGIRMLSIFIVNLLIAAGLACICGMSLYQKLKMLISGLKNLRNEKPVNLAERGFFKDVARSINDASTRLESKNRALAMRENARSYWIAGISHDIRTPLSMVMGYAEALSENEELSDANRHKAEIITEQSIRIKRLIEDLNLISSLEYDMQPSKRRPIRICPLIRGVISSIINSSMANNHNIELEFKYEKAVVSGDEQMLERAFYNLITNSIAHNEDGCAISIKEYKSGENVSLLISDSGTGVSSEVMEKISKIPKTAHGLGLPMAYRIIQVHNGKMSVWNDNGFHVMIDLPLE